MSRSGHEPAENHSSDRSAPAGGAGWPGPATANDPLFGPLPTGSNSGSNPPWTPQTGAAPWHEPQAWQPRSPSGAGPAPDSHAPTADAVPDGDFQEDDLLDEDFSHDGLTLEGPVPYGSGRGPSPHLRDYRLPDGLPDDDLPDELPDGDLPDDEDLPHDGPPDDEADWDGPPAERSWAWTELSQSLAARAVAFVTVALLVAVVVILFSGGDDESASPPDGSSNEPREVAADFVNSIRTDSDPVVPDEFFGQPTATVSDREYTRLNSRLDEGCPELTGAAGTPLTEATCRQLARAVYLSPPEPSGRLVLVGAAVFVVDEMATAQAAAEVFQTRQGGVLALPVAADQVPGATVLSPAGDNSWRQALTRGHYVIVLEAAYSDGTVGSPQDPPLQTAISDVEQLAVTPISDRARLGEGPPAPATTPASSAPPTTTAAPDTTAPSITAPAPAS